MSKIKKYNIIIRILIAIIILFLLCIIKYYNMCNNNLFINGDSIIHNFLILFYKLLCDSDIIGCTLGILIGFYISKKLAESTNKELKEMKKTQKEIRIAADDILSNSNQKTILNFPDLITEIIDLLNNLIPKVKVDIKQHKVNLNTDEIKETELYILNAAINFGYMHTYNYKFAQQFSDDYTIEEYDEKTFKNGVSKFNEKNRMY